MLTITCPFCGPRSENEFIHGGPNKNRRPEDPSVYTDREWIEYLTVPANPVGPVSEKWWHVRGCGEWVIIERNTLTHEISPTDSTEIPQASHHQPGQLSDLTSDDNNVD